MIDLQKLKLEFKCKEIWISLKLKLNIYCEIPDPTIVQSIYNYCHFEDYQSIQVEARELDGEKYELVIRIHNDEEIIIENLKNYIRETENQVVIKRVKLRTEDVN